MAKIIDMEEEIDIILESLLLEANEEEDNQDNKEKEESDNETDDGEEENKDEVNEDEKVDEDIPELGEENNDNTEEENSSDENKVDKPEGNNDGESNNQEEIENNEELSEKKLYFFNNFRDLYNITKEFISKVQSLKITNSENIDILNSIESSLQKQMEDLKFLLLYKLDSMDDENLSKLLLIFSSKTETLTEIIKNLTKVNETK